jgi:integrase
VAKRHRDLTDADVAAFNLKAGKNKAIPNCPHLFVRGHDRSMAYYVIARGPAGRQVWHKLGRVGDMKVDDARAAARQVVARIKAGKPAAEPAAPEMNTLRDVAEEWMAQVGKWQIARRQKEWRLRKILLPALGHLPLSRLDRSHVVPLLDKIAKDTPRLADMVRVDLGAIECWFAERNPSYQLQFKGTIKKRSTADPRERFLDPDKELPLIWAAADDAGTFGAFIKILLLTAQRRSTVAQMRWDQVTPLSTGEWRIPMVHVPDGMKKPKGHPEKLILPPLAINIINNQPRISPYVFSSSRGGYLSGLSQLKVSFDARLPAGMENWTLHDLRRSARTYMAEAEVKFEVAEKILGHSLGGIYDKSKLEKQTTAALLTLAQYIEEKVSANSAPVARIA